MTQTNDLEQAKKQVATEMKSGQKHYLKISFSYGTTVVLPYDDGEQLINSLKNCYSLTYLGSPDSFPAITPDIPNIEVKVMSYEEFKTLRMNGILKVDTREKD